MSWPKGIYGGRIRKHPEAPSPRWSWARIGKSERSRRYYYANRERILKAKAARKAKHATEPDDAELDRRALESLQKEGIR